MPPSRSLWACCWRGATTPARADTPNSGETFVISAYSGGKFLCATTRQDEGFAAVYPLVECNTDAPEQRWKLSPNGRQFQNVASEICLHDNSFLRDKKSCNFGAAGSPVWQQDTVGRVWRKNGDSISKMFWTLTEHQSYGPMLDFSGSSNGTIPDDASPFHLGVVATNAN